MGMTYIDGVATGPTGTHLSVRFLVDSGASYSVLPLDVWTALSLTPKRRVTFTLADGTDIQREVSECHLALAGQDGHSPVVLGEPGDEPILGVVTLENLGLVLDPFQRTLRSMHLRLS